MPVDAVVVLVGEIDDVGVPRVEDDALDVALRVDEPLGRREVLAGSGGGVPAGHHALVGVEVELVVGGAHREGLDGVPYGSEVAVRVEQVVVPLDVAHLRVGVVGRGVEIAVFLVADVGVIPVNVARGEVGSQQNARHQDAEVVEDLDAVGLLAHHIDAVRASVVVGLETHVEVVVLIYGDARFGFLREVRSGQRRGSRRHVGSLLAACDGRDVGLDDVFEDFVELRLVLFVLAHGDGDDALFARELGREDEHAVSRRGDDGGPFLVEIDVEGFGVGAEVPALDDDLGGYRAGFRVERFEYDGLIGPVARISPPLVVGARQQPQTCRQTGEPHVQAAFAVEIFHVLGLLG